jgi:hypothetical protein
MQQFIEKYREQINGALSGFDRLVFRGSLRRLNYGHYGPGLKAMVAKGMEEYLWQNKILFKDYQDHVKQVSERLKKASLEPLEKQKTALIFLRDPSVDKNQIARDIASVRGIASGPAGMRHRHTGAGVPLRYRSASSPLRDGSDDKLTSTASPVVDRFPSAPSASGEYVKTPNCI